MWQILLKVTASDVCCGSLNAIGPKSSLGEALFGGVALLEEMWPSEGSVSLWRKAEASRSVILRPLPVSCNMLNS